MFEISKHIEIDAGHRVPFHEAKCRHLHGHRYRITLTVQAEEVIAPDEGASDAGMVTDFGVLKQALMEEVHDPYDHRLLLWNRDPLVTRGPFQDAVAQENIDGGVVIIPCIPTAEELARWWGKRLQARLADADFEILSVEVRETPTSTATWWP